MMAKCVDTSWFSNLRGMSTSSKLAQLRNINQTTKDVVFGFIRLNITSPENANIPDLVKYTCLAFYHAKYFEESGTQIQLSGDDGAIITKIHDVDGWSNGIYGAEWIPSHKTLSSS